ncbi:GNAT family N-acetyltransferase [Neisseria flavescens]|uniref:GNAT family N-acetyltransferase n=1 Tax=Neisseria flavescens TaxID=484 RepID=UPI0012B9F8B5|nr:GNAT family N-acetyltransferase [Neisseria flavescens]
MPQTVTLVLYDPTHAADLDYRLHGEQAQYSVSPQERLQNGRFATPDCLAVTILCQNRPIGFFILDKGSDRLTYSANPRAVLLRSMSVNPAYQGQGCARAALADDKLAPLIRSILPDCDEIVFGVHHANRAAIGLYQSCGFADTGRTFMGTKGLQYIYSKTIR